MVNTSALHLEMKSTSTIWHSGGARRSKEIENNDQENHNHNHHDDFAHTGSINTRQDEDEGIFDAPESRGNETLLTGPVT